MYSKFVQITESIQLYDDGYSYCILDFAASEVRLEGSQNMIQL